MKVIVAVNVGAVATTADAAVAKAVAVAAMLAAKAVKHRVGNKTPVEIAAAVQTVVVPIVALMIVIVLAVVAQKVAVAAKWIVIRMNRYFVKPGSSFNRISFQVYS